VSDYEEIARRLRINTAGCDTVSTLCEAIINTFQGLADEEASGYASAMSAFNDMLQDTGGQD
jgi:hypothetical protein